MPSFTVDTGGTLTTSLESYFKLDEASGNRSDQVGSQTLTDNNTVGSTTGKQGNAANFIRGNSEYLSRATSAVLNAGDIDFSFAFWMRLASTPAGYMGIVTKWNTGNFEYFIAWDGNNSAGIGTNRVGFSIFNGAGTQKVLTASTFGALSTSTWYFVVVIHDAAADLMKISVNNGAFDTLATGGGHGSGNGASFMLGRAENDGGSHFDGDLDEVGFWKKVLSAQEITDLYNGGNGNTYSPSSSYNESRSLTVESLLSGASTVSRSEQRSTTIVSALSASGLMSMIETGRSLTIASSVSGSEYIPKRIYQGAGRMIAVSPRASGNRIMPKLGIRSDAPRP